MAGSSSSFIVVGVVVAASCDARRRAVPRGVCEKKGENTTNWMCFWISIVVPTEQPTRHARALLQCTGRIVIPACSSCVAVLYLSNSGSIYHRYLFRAPLSSLPPVSDTERREQTMSVGHWDPETARRIFRELRHLDESLPTDFTLEPAKPCDLSSWLGTFPGPVDTPYEEGTFEVNIQLPAEYWRVPPRVTFLTKVWNPNVSSTSGSTCLFTTDWSGILTLPKMLLCAHTLLCDGALDDSPPHDTVVAAQYVARREMFECTARDWTRRFAKKTPLGAFVGDHHEPKRYFAPDGWGDGELGESTSDEEIVKSLILKTVDQLAEDARNHLRAVLRHVDAHAELLPEGAYLCIANELKKVYNAIWPRLRA